MFESRFSFPKADFLCFTVSLRFRKPAQSPDEETAGSKRVNISDVPNSCSAGKKKPVRQKGLLLGAPGLQAVLLDFAELRGSLQEAFLAGHSSHEGSKAERRRQPADSPSRAGDA